MDEVYIDNDSHRAEVTPMVGTSLHGQLYCLESLYCLAAHFGPEHSFYKLSTFYHVCRLLVAFLQDSIANSNVSSRQVVHQLQQTAEDALHALRIYDGECTS